MEGLLTTLAFVAITALAVVFHLRQRSSSESCAPSCPRCQSRIPEGSAFCPSCGVPQQVFEIASARAVDTSKDATGPASDALHAVVRADVCVGCAVCVPVCPEAGAIRMEGKLAVVDRSRCTGHGKCVEACPVGGILLSTGAAVHRVEVPDVRDDFQTNVDGIYIVGELGGRGLIKNAVNEGRVATENVARELNGVRESPRPDPDSLDVAIVGSGPAGLSAGLEAERVGLRYVVLEQGTVADTIRKYPRHKLLLAEPVSIPLYGDLWVADASKETLLQVWETIIAKTGLAVRTGCRVEEVTRESDSFLLSGEGFQVRARRVILALGRRGTPRRLGIPGEEATNVLYDIVEMEAFRGKRVVVVGGGDSALEAAVGLANQAGTQVMLSYRKATFERAKERNVAKLMDAEAEGRVRVVRESEVVRISATEVELRTGGKTETLPNDYVIVRIGGEPPSRFLDKLKIQTVVKEVPIPGAEDAVPA